MEIKNSQKIVQKFLLVDSTSTLSRINDLKNDYQKIISFDLESDRILTNNSINHEISEKFLAEDELISIDLACIDFCQWYNENNGDRLLSYEGINLGSLFRVEFNNFLIPFLKNFMILVKIVKNFPDVTFLCSSTIYQILSKLVKNVQSLEEKSLESQLVWDKIQYNITDSISLKISKENFQKLKKISEMLTSVFLKGNNGKTVVEVSQHGGRYGKTTDNSNGPMSKGTEIEDGDGVSHKKEGGLKLEFNWEKQANNTYKVFANLI